MTRYTISFKGMISIYKTINFFSKVVNTKMYAYEK